MFENAKLQQTMADFPDWLSPVLVKELRQGLKTKGFVSAYLLVQIFMLVGIGGRLLMMHLTDDESYFKHFDNIFWSALCFPALIIPACGLFSVSSEIKANTLELVSLTRMSAFRIVFGKWVSLAAQTFLLATTVLPYLVLRYFFGKVDVIRELVSLGWILLASMILSALAVMLSVFSASSRVSLIAAGTIFFWVYYSYTLNTSEYISHLSNWFLLLLILGMFAANIYFLIETAASKIAPSVENRSARKRALVLMLTLLAEIFTIFHYSDADWAFLVASLIWNMGLNVMVLWTLMESLSERTVLSPSLYFPFASRGRKGMLLGRLLYPGWASGVCYVSLIGAGYLHYIYIYFNSYYPFHTDRTSLFLLYTPLLFTGIMVPVLMIRALPRFDRPFALYVFVQALMALIYSVTLLAIYRPHMNQAVIGEKMAWLMVFPLSGGLALLEYGEASEVLINAGYIVGLPICGLIWIYLINCIRKEFSIISALERKSLILNSGDKA